MAAYELTKKSGFYEKNPGTDVAVQQMIVKTTNNSRGVRAGNLPQIRDAIDEELEAVLGRQEDGEAGPRRRGQARQRDHRAVRQGEQGQ